MMFVFIQCIAIDILTDASRILTIFIFMRWRKNESISKWTTHKHFKKLRKIFKIFTLITNDEWAFALDGYIQLAIVKRQYWKLICHMNWVHYVWLMCSRTSHEYFDLLSIVRCGITFWSNWFNYEVLCPFIIENDSFYGARIKLHLEQMKPHFVFLALFNWMLFDA